MDQYDNVIKTLASTCVDDIAVKAEGLDKSAISFLWQVRTKKLEPIPPLESSFESQCHFFLHRHQNVNSSCKCRSVEIQESSHSVAVAGVCFQNGTPGPREICFSYMNYVGNVVVKLTAGDPAQIKLVSQPDQVRRGSSARVSYVFVQH